jgi:hypothetical protein
MERPLWEPSAAKSRHGPNVLFIPRVITMSEINGWLLQVTRGDPRDGDQQVDMYAAWDPSEETAAELVRSTFSLSEDELIAIVDTLPAEVLTKLGLTPGRACKYVEELAAG